MRAGALALAALALSCGGSSRQPPPTPLRESPAEGILRIGRVWEARENETGFRTAPSPIATFQTQVVSRLTLGAGAAPAQASVRYDDRFTLRDGRIANCSVSFELPASLAYGLKAGMPAIELQWSAARLPRTCDLPGFSAPELEHPAGRSRFVLRDDQLVAIEPPSEKRSFIPVE
jgi:hypothetical protein